MLKGTIARLSTYHWLILDKNLDESRSFDQSPCFDILMKFRMRRIVIKALMPLDRASSIKVYKNLARSTLIQRIAQGLTAYWNKNYL